MLWFVAQNCKNLACASFGCSLPENSSSQVNVTFRLWKPTFIKVSPALLRPCPPCGKAC